MIKKSTKRLLCRVSVASVSFGAGYLGFEAGSESNNADALQAVVTRPVIIPEFSDSPARLDVFNVPITDTDLKTGENPTTVGPSQQLERSITDQLATAVATSGIMAAIGTYIGLYRGVVRQQNKEIASKGGLRKN